VCGGADDATAGVVDLDCSSPVTVTVSRQPGSGAISPRRPGVSLAPDDLARGACSRPGRHGEARSRRVDREGAPLDARARPSAPISRDVDDDDGTGQDGRQRPERDPRAGDRVVRSVRPSRRRRAHRSRRPAPRQRDDDRPARAAPRLLLALTPAPSVRPVPRPPPPPPPRVVRSDQAVRAAGGG
jgi:hypothetical protein